MDSHTLAQQAAGTLQSTPTQQQQLSSTATATAASVPIPGLPEDSNSSTPPAGRDAQQSTLQLLPGLSLASVEPVAARMLDPSKVQLGRRLGAGAFATVYEAQLEGSKAKWVVKRLDRAGPDHSQHVSNEVEMLVFAGNHPNLVPFKGWYVDSSSVLCLLLGQCEGGTLSSLLKSRSGGADEGLFEEDMVMCWFVQLLLALHHLHGRRILHRDLKPENVLLSKNYRVVKLADFGVSKQLEAGVGLAVTCLGTPHYMSPEVITHRPYTFASDMWALGAVLYEMAARRPAFDARGLPQLVMKILRNAYTPLPLACSKPVQQLVGMLLRADPDDRPTTADLLATSLVRKHLHLLLGLAQRVHRAPAAAAAAAAGGAGPNGASCDQAGATTESSDCSTPAVQQPSDQQQQLLQVDVSCEQVDLGNGLSLALRDMMLAVKRMARAPLHNSSGSSSPNKRNRMPSAPAAAVEHSASSAGTKPSASGGSSNCGNNSSSGRRPTSRDSSSPAAVDRAAGSSRGSTRAGWTSQTAAAVAAAGSTETLDESPGSSAAATASPTPSGGSTTAAGSGGAGGGGAAGGAAAAYAALPAPVAVPGTKRQLVHAWDASAHWEAQQKKQAEARYQARILEQRMAREQARQRRKELDPAAAAKAAQQQQELQLLEEAYRRRQQQQPLEPDHSSGTAGDPLSMSAEAAAAAAAAIQDEQLQLLLEQLRGAAGSSSSSPAPGSAPAAAGEEGLADMAGAESEVEEEEGLQGLDTQTLRANLNCEDEDYSEALALAAAGENESDVRGISSSSSSSDGDGNAGDSAANPTGVAAAAAAGRAWQLVMASLEDDSFAALLPCKAAFAAPADSSAAALPAVAEADAGAEATDEQGDDAAASSSTAGVTAPVAADDTGLPVLIQSSHSPESSPRSNNRLSTNQQQQQQNMLFSQLEQQLESALSRSDSAAAQELMSSIYRMSLCARHRQDDCPALPEQAEQGASSRQGLGFERSRQGCRCSRGPVQESFKRPGKARPKSAIEAIRDEKASTAFANVVNTMFGNVLIGGDGGAPEMQRSSSSRSMGTARLLALQQLQEQQQKQQQQQQQQQQGGLTAASTGNSPRAPRHSVTASPKLGETILPCNQPGNSILPCIHTGRTPRSSTSNIGSGTLVAVPGSPFVIDTSALHNRSSSSTRNNPASRRTSELLIEEQRPTLAAIGGLPTSRPAFAAAPPAVELSPASRHSSSARVGHCVASKTPLPQHSSNSTPKVDGALQLLRGHKLSGSRSSSRQQGPVAAEVATAAAACSSPARAGASSPTAAEWKPAAAAPATRLVPSSSSKRLSAGTQQLFVDGHSNNRSKTPQRGASSRPRSVACNRLGSSGGSRPSSTTSSSSSRPSTAGSLQGIGGTGTANITTTVSSSSSSSSSNRRSSGAAAAAAGGDAHSSAAPAASATSPTNSLIKQRSSSVAVPGARDKHAVGAFASRSGRVNSDSIKLPAGQAHGLKLNRHGS